MSDISKYYDIVDSDTIEELNTVAQAHLTELGMIMLQGDFCVSRIEDYRNAIARAYSGNVKDSEAAQLTELAQVLSMIQTRYFSIFKEQVLNNAHVVRTLAKIRDKKVADISGDIPAIAAKTSLADAHDVFIKGLAAFEASVSEDSHVLDGIEPVIAKSLRDAAFTTLRMSVVKRIQTYVEQHESGTPKVH